MAGDTFVDFEHGLNAAVKRLRDVLGDSAEAPRFIETVPRRGYRFIAPVDSNDSRTVVAPVVVPVPAPARFARRAPRMALAAATLAFAVSAGVAYWRSREPSPAAADIAPMRVVRLTTLKGHTNYPMLSPGGDQVAFMWDGDEENNADVVHRDGGLLRDAPTDDGSGAPITTPAGHPTDARSPFTASMLKIAFSESTSSRSWAVQI